ncbi:MAG: ClpXP protease specificity-enhancing factor [Betaproteobacteria bacterium]|jgi:stringent starvation protein B|nr:ClpXP protease specificity-enhancing factor [Betaproteobacteria bacterium]
MINISQSSSTRPYLVRALHEWCTDNGLTPYIAVLVDDSVQVPREYVNNGEIVLNISFDATSNLQLGNEYVVFKARFGGVAREISVPVARVIAIYARENGQGMAFPAPSANTADTQEDAPAKNLVSAVKPLVGLSAAPSQPTQDSDQPTDPKPPTPNGFSGAARPQLKRVK